MEMKEGLSKLDIKVANRKMILTLLENNQALSRIRLAKMTNMSPTSMTRIIQELSDLNLVIPVDGDYSGIGRKSIMLSTNSEAFYILGLNINEATITFCIMNYSLESLYYKTQNHHFTHRTSVSPRDLVDYCYTVYQSFQAEILIKDKEFSFAKIKKLGISFAGTVDSEEKYVISCPCFAWNEDRTMCRYFEEVFQMPISIENDTKASLINEYYRYPKHRADSIAFFTFDWGIGCSVMYNGKLIKGFHSGAGELAHIIIPDFMINPINHRIFYSRPLFYNGIQRMAADRGFHFATLKELEVAYHEGNEIIIALFEEVSHYIASLFNIIICMYNPEKVILGGNVFHEAPVLIDLALSHKEYLYSDISKNISFELTYEKSDEALLGGAVIAVKQYRNELIAKKFS